MNLNLESLCNLGKIGLPGIFKDEKMMKEMIQHSIELEGLDKAWIIHGSKNI
jgi:hypothetical protein